MIKHLPDEVVGLAHTQTESLGKSKELPQIISILLKKKVLGCKSIFVLRGTTIPLNSGNTWFHKTSILFFYRPNLKWKILIYVGERLGHQGQSLISLFDRWHKHQIKAADTVLVVLEVRANTAVFLVRCTNGTWPGGFLANETGERTGRTWQIQPGGLTTIKKTKEFVHRKLLG